MGGRGLWAAVVALALFSTANLGFAAKGLKETDAPDLQATAALVKRWATRRSFPESVTFAYYHLYMARALGLEITPETRKQIIKYISDCQQPDGGFTPKPLHTKTSSVIYTYYALRALDLLGEMKAIDGKGAVDFLKNLVRKGGGMVATTREGERANLATTYYGIEALRLLGAADSLDAADTLSFVERYREKGRGFTRVEGAVSIPQATYMGVRALKGLGALTATTRIEIIDYLKGTRYSGLHQDQQYRLQPTVEAMAATLESLAVLSGMQEVDRGRIEEFIRSLYVAQNGGFGPRPGLGTTPPSTYHAILSLVMLGKLPDPFTQKQLPHSDAGP